MKKKEAVTPRAFKIKHAKETLLCDRCPPHQMENAKAVRKHGVKKKRKGWKE